MSTKTVATVTALAHAQIQRSDRGKTGVPIAFESADGFQRP